MDTDQIHMTEYVELKDEQRDRMRRRDALVRETWLATLVVLGVVSGGANAALLLILPAVTLTLGWTYLRNDRMVTAIRRYIVAHIKSRLTVGAEALAWETTPQRRGRVLAKAVQLLVDLTTFVAPAIAAPIAYLVLDGGPSYLAVALFEILAAAGLAVLFMGQVDTSR